MKHIPFSILLLFVAVLFSCLKKKELATVSTTSITNKTASGCISGGTITSDGGADVTGRGVCWSKDANPSIANYKSSDGKGAGTFTSNVSELEPGTTYHMRAYATNGVGTAYGNEVNLTTLQIIAPSLTTIDVTDITSSTAVSGGNVTDAGNGIITARGVCWSTSPVPTIDLITRTTDGTGTGILTSNLTGLTPSTKYYIRAYATNSAGTNYGNELSFTTNCATPSAPVVGTITQPTCAVATGSVALSGLPSTGTWTLTRTPGGTTTSGTGTTRTVTGLPAGTTYTFTVTNASGCVSAGSGNVTISAQPATPSAPVVGTITQPTCALATGSVALSGLPSSGWTLTRTPGGTITTGTATTATITGLPAGTTYTFSVTNTSGCVSAVSGNVTINTQLASPSAPVVGTITQPTCSVATGSVALSGLPSSGWTLTRTPGGTTTTGTATTTTVSGLPAATTYTFTVTNASGCVSAGSGNVTFSAQQATPSAPVVGTITQPTCALATGSVALSGLPSTGWTLTRTPGGTITTGTATTATITGLPAGTTYLFTVTNTSGCVSAVSGNVTINAQQATPSAPIVGTITQPSCVVATGSVALSGLPVSGWTLTRTPGGTITTGTATTATITGLPAGTTYTFTVTNASGCVSAGSGNVTISAQPATPSAPVVGTITQPTCAVATGSVALSGLPSSGWTLTRAPGGTITTGTATTSTITGLPAGTTYTFSVTNTSGCVSAVSGNVTINAQQATPSAPIVGTITQPSCAVATGSVALSGLPSSGWTLTRTPGGTITTGTATTATITGLPAGTTYTFSVTNTSGCVSAVSGNVTINAQQATPSAPIVGTITQPSCAVATGSVALSGLPSTGTWTLTRAPGGTTTSGTGTTRTVTGLPAGTTYTFTVTNGSGCVSAASGNIIVNLQPALPSAATGTYGVTANYVVLDGTINANGSTAVVTFEYGTTTGYGSTISANPGTVTGNANTIVSATVTGLSPNTDYHYRVSAVSCGVTVYGSDAILTTLPSLTTNIVSSKTISSASSGGSIPGGGASISERGICWDIAPNPTVAGNHTSDGTGTGSFTSNITGLIANTTYYLRAYAVNNIGTGYGNQVIFTTLSINPVIFNPGSTYGTLTDIEGNAYKTIQIGSQVWMAENLRTTKYSDGADITNATDYITWGALTSGAYCWYENDINYKNTYGALYNWYTVNNLKLCPNGWHVPSDVEWTTLTTSLGGESMAGSRLKESGITHWLTPNSGASNDTGFTALPGGSRYASGTFYEIGNTGLWWSSTEYTTVNSWYRYMIYTYSDVARFDTDKRLGFSVRCMKD